MHIVCKGVHIYTRSVYMRFFFSRYRYYLVVVVASFIRHFTLRILINWNDQRLVRVSYIYMKARVFTFLFIVFKYTYIPTFSSFQLYTPLFPMQYTPNHSWTDEMQKCNEKQQQQWKCVCVYEREKKREWGKQTERERITTHIQTILK